MFKKIIIFLFCVFLSCDFSANHKLEFALNFAGHNKIELQKVLEHYKYSPLRYKAAVFLIENIPYYFSYEDERLEKYKKEFYDIAVNNNFSDSQTISFLEKKYGKLIPPTYKVVYDAHVITADYIIDNIDFSFEVWENSKWFKNVNFEDFCETILPYRIGNEKIESWRRPFYNRFQPLLDSLQLDDDPLSACQIIIDDLLTTKWIFNWHLKMPSRGAFSLLEKRFGTCDDQSELVLYAMRSVGIVGGIDLMFQRPDKNQSWHSWNYIKDSYNNEYAFTLDSEEPIKQQVAKEKIANVYRKSFSIVETSLRFITDDNKKLPNAFNNAFIENVSSHYYKGNTFKMEVDKGEKENYFLAVYNKEKWIPVLWGALKNKLVVFEDIASDVVYMPGIYNNGDFKSISTPFYFKDDVLVPLIPSLKDTISLHLTRKHPLASWLNWYKNRSLGGEFQASNDSDFNNYDVLHVINEEADMFYHTVDLDNDKSYKYLRYFSGPNGHCNMAEVEFYDFNRQKIVAEIIGTEGSFEDNKNRTKYAVFDNDPLTFYDAIEANGAWAGLKLKKGEKISQIKYIFRNDDNTIRIGDEYELVYWYENQWHSLGKKMAIDNYLDYENVPNGVLFLLRNLSRGVEERIFTYENHSQIWW